MLFVDESGFYLLPMATRTYAPIGRTPVLHERATRDHLSAMAGITTRGKLYMMVQKRPYNGLRAAAFLRHLLKLIPGRLLVIWDGSPIHAGCSVAELLGSAEGKRLQLERLPGYAPDLNPAELVWNYLKRAELKNVTCHSLPELRVRLEIVTRRLRERPRLISAFVQHLDHLGAH